MPISSRLRVLIVNQYYPPDTSATAGVFHDAAHAFARAGHRVSVLAGRPSYDPEVWFAWRPISTEADGDVIVERVGSTALDRRSMRGRALNYLSFFLFATLRALLMRRPDVVVAGSDPPLAVWTAMLAARGRPVVYSLQDLHPDHAVACGMIQPGALARAWEAVHRAALRRCRLVVCLGRAVAERVREKGVAPERIAVVPWGAWPPTGAPVPSTVQELRRGAEFVVTHAGNLGGAGAWETLAEAARSADGEAEFLFVGDGVHAATVSRAGVRVVPFRPVDELPSVMAAGDVQVVTLRPGMEGAVVPSKLYTILAHGRPILAVVPAGSDVAAVVHEWGCGLTADPERPDDVAAKVRWARDHPEAVTRMSARALLASRRFERGRCLQRLVRLVEAVAAGETEEAQWAGAPNDERDGPVHGMPAATSTIFLD